MGWRFKIGNISVNSDQIKAIKNIKKGVEDGTIQKNIDQMKDLETNGVSYNPFGFIILGLLFLVIATFLFKITPAFNSNYIEVTGEIVDIDSERNSEGTYMYTPEVKYEVEGNIYKSYLSESTSSNKYFEGETIDVYYKIDSPEIIRTNSSILPIVFLAVFGGLSIILGIIAIIKNNN